MKDRRRAEAQHAYGVSPDDPQTAASHTRSMRPLGMRGIGPAVRRAPRPRSPDEVFGHLIRLCLGAAIVGLVVARAAATTDTIVWFATGAFFLGTAIVLARPFLHNRSSQLHEGLASVSTTSSRVSTLPPEVNWRPLKPVVDGPPLARCGPEVARYELAYFRTARVIRTYTCEGAALAFVRDVVLFGSRADAAQFRLQKILAGPRVATIAEGERLVTRALQDRIL